MNNWVILFYRLPKLEGFLVYHLAVSSLEILGHVAQTDWTLRSDDEIIFYYALRCRQSATSDCFSSPGPKYVFLTIANPGLHLHISSHHLTAIKAIPFLASLTALFNACSSVSVHFTLSWSHFLILYSFLNCVCIACKRLISRGSPLPL
jgi:hypothetical protein